MSVIHKLAADCKLRIGYTIRPVCRELYEETVDLIVNSNLDEQYKLDLLIEMHKYAFYSPVPTSLDSRGDIGAKHSMLFFIKR